MANTFRWPGRVGGGALMLTLLTLACGGDDGSDARPDASQLTDSAPALSAAQGSGIVPTLAPATGPSGTQVTLTASGLPPEAAVEIGFGAPQQNFEVLTQTTVDAQGNLTSVVTVPSWAEAGRDYHFVIARVNQPPLGLSRAFQVTAR